MLAEAISGVVGKAEWVLVDVNAGKLSRLKEKLVYCFELATDMIEGCVKDGPAFPKWAGGIWCG